MCSPRACNQLGYDRPRVVGALNDVVRKDPTERVVDDDHARVDHATPRSLVAGQRKK